MGKEMHKHYNYKSRGSKINCPYCPGCSTAFMDKWKFSTIHHMNIIWTSKKNASGKKCTSTYCKSKSDFARPEEGIIIPTPKILMHLGVKMLYSENCFTPNFSDKLKVVLILSLPKIQYYNKLLFPKHYFFTIFDYFEQLQMLFIAMTLYFRLKQNWIFITDVKK